MHRRVIGGKRIRLDDPIPPEYENPQTPMTPVAPAEHDELNESFHRMYATLPSTPQHSGSDIYNESEYEREGSYDHNDPDAMEGKLGYLKFQLSYLSVGRYLTYYLSVCHHVRCVF